MEREVFARSEVAGAARRLHNISWPEECPLHLARDLWGKHELAKSRAGFDGGMKAGSQEWRCALSGKVFKSEHYVDLHMERNFMNETPRDGACLANYCDALSLCGRKPEPSWAEALSSETPACDPAELKTWQTQCADLLSRCVPHASISGMPDANMTHVEHVLYRAWCEPLTCESKIDRHFTERRHLIIACVIGGRRAIAQQQELLPRPPLAQGLEKVSLSCPDRFTRADRSASQLRWWACGRPTGLISSGPAQR